MPSIIFIMGVSGSGKSLIGSNLSTVTGIPFYDADDFHTSANKEKMAAGIPLTDDDRKPWLKVINEIARKASINTGAIIACSALRESYRTILTEGLDDYHWIHLTGEFDLISERMESRKGHFMPKSLLKSQFDILEPAPGALVVDIKKSPAEIIAEIREHLSV